MDNKTRYCSVCGEKYQFCPKCKEDKNKELFYFVFCSHNCKNIYEVTSEFEDKKISKEEAKNKLSNLDLSKIKNFGTSYKNSIKEIKEVKVSVEADETKDIVLEKSISTENKTSKNKIKNIK